MTGRIRSAIERIRSHILFLPGVMAVGAGALAVGLVELDRQIDAETVREIPWIFRAGASGAREVLSTIASAIVQLAAITFSVTIVALALRSQQFGPRLLRNFVADPVNQSILGVFIGTFVYALLVLRAVRDVEDTDLEVETFIPFVAVTGAIVLSLVSLALFVVFIDRVVTSIQANSIIEAVAKETRAAIRRLFPDELGEDALPEEAERFEPLPGGVAIVAHETGYVQVVESEELMQIACEAEIVLRMEVPIGGFVSRGAPLVTVAPSERIDDDLMRKIRRAYAIARDRATHSDPEFGVRQIVDVAVKALSPSDNDPTTAVTATEYLGSVLLDFAGRVIPSPIRRDERGDARVLALGPTFRSMADLAFDQIREYGAHDPAITLALLDAIARIARGVRLPSHGDVLESHVWRISRSADREIREPTARQAVNRRLEHVLELLGRDDILKDAALTIAAYGSGRALLATSADERAEA